LITFQRGNLTRDSAVLLGVVLAVYSASLIGSAVQRALLAPFFARLDTRTPLRNTVYGVLANLVLLPVLVLPFGVRNVSAVVGVAIAYSLAQYVNVAHAWYRLRREIGTPRTGPRRWLLSVVGMSLVSSAVMVVAYGLLRLDQPWHRGELILRTGLVGVGGLAALVVAAHFLRVAAPHASWRRMLPTQAQGRA